MSVKENLFMSKKCWLYVELETKMLFHLVPNSKQCCRHISFFSLYDTLMWVVVKNDICDTQWKSRQIVCFSLIEDTATNWRSRLILFSSHYRTVSPYKFSWFVSTWKMWVTRLDSDDPSLGFLPNSCCNIIPIAKCSPL